MSDSPKKEFSAGDVHPSGDCAMFEAGINHHAPRSGDGDWFQRIVIYGRSEADAEALRNRLLVALLSPPEPGKAYSFIPADRYTAKVGAGYRTVVLESDHEILEAKYQQLGVVVQRGGKWMEQCNELSRKLIRLQAVLRGMGFDAIEQAMEAEVPSLCEAMGTRFAALSGLAREGADASPGTDLAQRAADWIEGAVSDVLGPLSYGADDMAKEADGLGQLSVRLLRELRGQPAEEPLTIPSPPDLSEAPPFPAVPVDSAEEAPVLPFPDEAATRPQTPYEKCVHTEHCCAKHGCKYGDDNCPVALGTKPQSYLCEQCEDDERERAEWEQRLGLVEQDVGLREAVHVWADKEGWAPQHTIRHELWLAAQIGARYRRKDYLALPTGLLYRLVGALEGANSLSDDGLATLDELRNWLGGDA